MLNKKIYSLLIALILIIQTAVFAQDVSVMLNGEELALVTAPYIKDGRTMVPLKIFESFGATVSWDSETRTAMVAYFDADGGIKVIYLQIGSKTVFVNDTETLIDVASEISNSRTMVPLSFIAENLGATVLWDADTYTVNITTDK